MADDDQALPIRKSNRVHKLRQRRKVEDNPMSGGSLRRIYPAVLRRHLVDTKKPAEDTKPRPR